MLGNNIAKALPYLLNFWNGVDLRYRGLESPKFRLNIAGFVFAKDNKALEYMAKNSLKQNFSDVGNALFDMSLFWYQRRWDIPLESYDVVTTMTGDELCSYGIATKENCTTLGLSFIGGACQVSTKYPLFLGVSIIKDNYGYGGVAIAAHELGHSFGVKHDDREHCPHGNGVNLMSPTRADGASSLDWSDCSLKDFSKFLSSNVSVCLQNKPNSGKALPKYLPGKTMSADEQCKAMGYIEAVQNGPEICESLKCILRFEDVPVVENGSDYMLTKWWYTAEGVAAEGTACDDKKICLHNQCIEEEKTK
ncbi:venom metalloproteinase 3-like [Aphidius gifuensis]|uniref:venom metalloproteinase 3-like n=1 Tax=Aphidius gifuensis TaxID=684658 RepID=UPI001CDB8AE9|nr:venom metalloproteinase 3-like [Aphidius gifuensis]